MLTDEQLLASPTIRAILASSGGLHKSAAPILGVSENAGLEDYVRALGTKLAAQQLRQQKIAEGLSAYAELKGVASPGTLPFAADWDFDKRAAATAASGGLLARLARRAAASHAPPEALAAAAAHVPKPPSAPSHLYHMPGGDVARITPTQASWVMEDTPERLLALPKGPTPATPAAPAVMPKKPAYDAWDQSTPVRRKQQTVQEIDIEGLREHLRGQGFDPEALGFAAPNPKLAAFFELSLDKFANFASDLARMKAKRPGAFPAPHAPAAAAPKTHIVATQSVHNMPTPVSSGVAQVASRYAEPGSVVAIPEWLQKQHVPEVPAARMTQPGFGSAPAQAPGAAPIARKSRPSINYNIEDLRAHLASQGHTLTPSAPASAPAAAPSSGMLSGLRRAVGI